MTSSFRHLRVLLACASAGLMLGTSFVKANDTFAEMAAGGLQISRSNEVEMVSEDLYISPSEVRVDYNFRNATDRDIETTVAFPMPTLDMNPAAMQAVADPENENFMHFTVTQDGQPIKPNLEQRAFLDTFDYTDTLKAAKVPVFALPQSFSEALSALPKTQREEWRDLGLVTQDDPNEDIATALLYPAWTLHSTYWWKTTFPAGKTVTVHHSYVPNVGGTSGVSMSYEAPDSPRMKAYQRKYCMDDAFINKAKAIADHQGLPEDAVPMEKWLSYILVTGGNWQGARIGKYHLTIDKERPEDIVSFCGEGVKKTGPTTFEIEATDYDPSRNIDVLIVGGFVP